LKVGEGKVAEPNNGYADIEIPKDITARGCEPNTETYSPFSGPSLSLSGPTLPTSLKPSLPPLFLSTSLPPALPIPLPLSPPLPLSFSQLIWAYILK
jgi:hypothetical protein